MSLTSISSPDGKGLATEAVDKIQGMISRYKRMISETGISNELYKWELAIKYQGLLNPEEADFPAKLTSVLGNNLFYYMPVATAKELASQKPQEYRLCYVDLFNDALPLDSRIASFTHTVDALYRSLGKDKPARHDERTASNILTFYNPSKYTYFKDSYYQAYCKLINEKPHQVGSKYSHYLSLMQDLIDNYIKVDDELVRLVKEILTDKAYIDPNYMILAQDILYQTFDYEASDEYEDKQNDNTNTGEDTMQIPLNTILYGPPGTGKTYNSINKAVEIADPVFMKNTPTRSDVTKRYKELVDKGRIVFTTFHQSISYEDFIEGIKPVTNDDNSISYNVLPGLFKKLCTIATYSAYTKTDSKGVTRDVLFELAFDKLWDDVRKTLDSKEAYEVKTKENYPINIIELSDRGNLIIQHMNNVTETVHTVSRNKLLKLFMKYQEIGEIKKVGDIRDLVGGCDTSAYWAILNMIYNVSSGIQVTANPKLDIQELDYESMATAIAGFDWSLLNDASKNSLESYVLIIDEINRGNVSQIFGELITLFEPDKRAGMKEALEVTLPYSKENFSVPPNLYIIGTMNTADRSVEALDTALRRRFSFTEMAPDYGLLKGKPNDYGIDLGELLEIINKRIEALLDKDHAIGHSYFLRVLSGECSLKDVFFNEIIPLLQEYFYGNFGRIELVLGTGFVKSTQVTQSVFAKPSANNDDFVDTTRYTLVRNMDNAEFKTALQILMS